MKYNYSRFTDTGRDRIIQRLLEILPGAVSWTIIIGLAVFAFLSPLLTSGVMIAFLLYWVFRVIYMNIFLIFSYVKLHMERDTDWMSRLKYLDMSHDAKRPVSGDIYHVLIIPVVNEAKEIVEPGITEILKGKFPTDKILIALALEEVAPDNVKKDIRYLAEKYKSRFLDFLVIQHKSFVKGEARVKGANSSNAAREVKKYFDNIKIPYEKIIVSCFDADTIPHKDYFACLTYYFLITPERTKRSYQPIPVYHNNIWDAPAFARIIDIGTSFFELVEATNPRKLVTFSSHSMSFKALVDVGFWPPDMISDDSAIFWKAFIHYDGKYATIPIYTTVSMDIAMGKNIKETFLAIYRQKRRWAWGVENFPIIMRAFIKSKTISLYEKITHGYKIFDTFVSWATWSFLLAFVSWLPALFANKEFTTSTVYYTVPRIRSVIFALSLIGIMVCMAISVMMLPAKKKSSTFRVKITHVLEWVGIPVIILLLSAMPAIDAQTRLITGRYMEFSATKKHRSKK